MRKFLLISLLSFGLGSLILFPFDFAKAEAKNYCLKCTNYGTIVSDVTAGVNFSSEDTLDRLKEDLHFNIKDSEIYKKVKSISADCENGGWSNTDISDKVTITEGTCESSHATITNSNQYVTLSNPISANSVPELVGVVIKSLLGLVGALALLMFVWGGFTWVMSGGNAEKVQKGTQIMIWATVGILVVLASYILVNYFISNILA